MCQRKTVFASGLSQEIQPQHWPKCWTIEFFSLGMTWRLGKSTISVAVVYCKAGSLIDRLGFSSFRSKKLQHKFLFWWNPIKLIWKPAIQWYSYCEFCLVITSLSRDGSSNFKWLTNKNRYLVLVRKLQQVYRMEPAGSQGVWALDDFQVRFLKRTHHVLF